jgi:pilus assembly protein CpaE
MDGRISCLIIDKDPETIRHVDVLGRKLGTIDLRWKTGAIATGIGIIRKHLPEMAVIGLGPEPEAEIESIAAISREFPAVYLLVLSDSSDADLILRTMRAGANDFLGKPVKESDLRAATEKIHKLMVSRKEAAVKGGKILSVFCNKGGNGTTTIAVNLADALSRYHGKKVVLVDLVLVNGDVTLFFNVTPDYSILDLARSAGQADYDFLHSLLVKHSSGVYILAGPPMIEAAEQISAAQVREVLSALRSMFDFIVVDTPHQFDERTLTALEMSDQILLISTLNLPSLKNTQKCLDLFGRLGLRDERVYLVLNRYLPNEEISKESIQGIMNCPVFFAVPNDYPTVISSMNRGKLLREIAPGKEVTLAFRRLADLLVGPKTGTTEQAKGGFFGRLFKHNRGSK